MFRQTLVCRAEEPVDRTPNPSRLRNLAVSTQAKRREDGFEGPTGTRLTTDNPLVLAALERAAEAWPAAVWVRDLAASDSGVSLCDAPEMMPSWSRSHCTADPVTAIEPSRA